MLSKRLYMVMALLLLAGAAQVFPQWKDDGPLAPAPRNSPPIYTGDAKANGKKALAEAKKSGKRVILDFGGDWCYDCHVLEYNLQSDARLHALVEANYVVAHVDVGEFNRN